MPKWNKKIFTSGILVLITENDTLTVSNALIKMCGFFFQSNTTC